MFSNFHLHCDTFCPTYIVVTKAGLPCGHQSANNAAKEKKKEQQVEKEAVPFSDVVRIMNPRSAKTFMNLRNAKTFR